MVPKPRPLDINSSETAIHNSDNTISGISNMRLSTKCTSLEGQLPDIPKWAARSAQIERRKQIQMRDCFAKGSLIKELNEAKSLVRSGLDPEILARENLRGQQEDLEKSYEASHFLAHHTGAELDLTTPSWILPDAPTPSNSNFLSLPAEIRMMIYRFAICGENLEAKSCTQGNKRRKCLGHQSCCKKEPVRFFLPATLQSLLLVNCQVWTESRPLMKRTTTLVLCVESLYAEYLHMISFEMKHRLRAVRVSCDTHLYPSSGIQRWESNLSATWKALLMGRLLCHFRKVTCSSCEFDKIEGQNWFMIEMEVSEPRERVLLGVDEGD
jgi:hypothetical protein